MVQVVLLMPSASDLSESFGKVEAHTHRHEVDFAVVRPLLHSLDELENRILLHFVEFNAIIATFCLVDLEKFFVSENGDFLLDDCGHLESVAGGFLRRY